MSAESVRFVTQWSKLVWVITIGVVAAIVIAEVLLVRAVSVVCNGGTMWVLCTVIALLPLDIFGTVAFYSPRSYTVRPDAVVVNRFGPAVVMPFDEVREIRRIDAREIGLAWRVFASGGFLGWVGWFYSRRLGRFRAYATNQRDLVLIVKTDGTKIVVSPHPPEAFLEAVSGGRERRA